MAKLIQSAAGNKDSAEQENRGCKQLGHMPTSVGVQKDVGRDMEESSEEESFSSANDASSTASVAVLETHPPGTSG